MVRASRLQALAAMALIGGAAAGCANYPADPAGSLQQATGGELIVGITEHPPWTQLDAEQPSGSEVDLLKGYAEGIDAEIRWVTGSESELVGQLAAGDLDLVIGGFDEGTPWQQAVAPSRPYHRPQEGPGRIVLVEQGENALLLDLESYFIQQEAQ
ncbi:transporter substrate-binding domain-containing protein [Nesterenkonia sp.]|uniref:transporter substrate-binding domain-containing protein n=1 Tax=Nesterenkonia sp. TaxID=704201 RepID=UPI0026129B68|nr:transporter substrate-binding domain-containing protein [Nesterenkonia sp.]